MSTGTYILRSLTVALFVLAVCTPIMRQLVDCNSVQIQLVEELPEEEKEQDKKDEKQKDKVKKFCSAEGDLTSLMIANLSRHSSLRVQSADFSSMPDPPPELS